MTELAGDEGVFIRSMATRGNLGGLAAATSDTVQVLDAAGYEIILIETVGAGQNEVDIAKNAHTTMVVEAPGLGDDIQAIKAGILGIWNLARQRNVFLSLMGVLWFLIILFKLYIGQVYNYHILEGIPDVGSLLLFVIMPILLLLAFFTGGRR